MKDSDETMIPKKQRLDICEVRSHANIPTCGIVRRLLEVHGSKYSAWTVKYCSSNLP
jgi:hypothetical protein